MKKALVILFDLIDDFSKNPEQADNSELSVEEAVYIASRILKSVSGDDTDDGDLQKTDA